MHFIVIALVILFQGVLGGTALWLGAKVTKDQLDWLPAFLIALLTALVSLIPLPGLITAALGWAVMLTLLYKWSGNLAERRTAGAGRPHHPDSAGNGGNTDLPLTRQFSCRNIFYFNGDFVPVGMKSPFHCRLTQRKTEISTRSYVLRTYNIHETGSVCMKGHTFSPLNLYHTDLT